MYKINYQSFSNQLNNCNLNLDKLDDDLIRSGNLSQAMETR